MSMETRRGVQPFTAAVYGSNFTKNGEPQLQSINRCDSAVQPALKGLNAAQRTAVTTSAQIVQILAPPGSGKTRTLTSRVAYLLSEHGLNPHNVIVATFTVKAANEMKDRLKVLVGEGVERRLLLGTFHSIARRYLAIYGHLIGLKPSWQIADSAASLAICKKVISRRKMPIDAGQLRSRISHFKARKMSPRENITARSPASTFPVTQSAQNRKNDLANDDFVMLYEDYHAALDASNQLDYDDLLLRCAELLQELPQCVSNIEAVLIDEFQDTNNVQFELMRLFAWKKKRITIVGDPDQSIYGFRAAEVGNLKRMKRAYPDTFVINLENNYRSSASILHAAQEVIRQDETRQEKPLMPTHEPGTSPVLRRVISSPIEAEWIVSEIKRIRAMSGGMIRLDGIAILVRSASLTRNIETAFAKNGLAYRMVGGIRFFDRAEVKIVMDYLRILHNPANSDAVARVINVPSRKVGDKTITTLLEEADRNNKTLWHTLSKGTRGHSKWDIKVSKSAEKGIGEFHGLLSTLMRWCDDESKTLPNIIDSLLKKMGYELYLQQHYPEDWEGRWANVLELISQAKDLSLDGQDLDMLPEIEGIKQREQNNTVRAVLERFLVNAALVNEKAEQAEETSGEITISTIHAAKGLEWPIVFIPSVYEGSIPHSRAEDVDEERRLLYVAMTRAQGMLYLSCPLRNTANEKTALSSFIDNQHVKKCLIKRGPPLTFSTVQNLGRILSLRCPSERQVSDWLDMNSIPSELDDQFKDKDPSDGERDGEDDLGSNDYRQRKRRRCSPTEESLKAPGWVPAKTLTTEARVRTQFTTVQKIGFQSASNHLLNLRKQGNTNCEAEGTVEKQEPKQKTVVSTARTTSTKTFTRVRSSVAKPSKPSNPSDRVSSRVVQPNQGSILNFLRKAPSTTPKSSSEIPSQSVKTATEISKSFPRSNQSLKQQLDMLPPPVIPSRADGEVILLSSPPRKTLGIKRSLNGWPTRSSAKKQ